MGSPNALFVTFFPAGAIFCVDPARVSVAMRCVVVSVLVRIDLNCGAYQFSGVTGCVLFPCAVC